MQEPEAAMEYMRMLVDLRDLYLHVTDKGVKAGGHQPLTPSWDNHKVGRAAGGEEGRAQRMRSAGHHH